MNPVFMFRPKITHFNQVYFSKTSFSVAPSGDEKVFTTNRTQFCMSRQKILCFNQVFSWYNSKNKKKLILQYIDTAINWPAINWPCDESIYEESTLRWIDPAMHQSAMNRPCDESTYNELTLWWIDLQWIDLAMNRPCNDLTLRWIDPVIKRLCDESTPR
jgi:hypothetical protein